VRDFLSGKGSARWDNGRGNIHRSGAGLEVGDKIAAFKEKN